MSDSNIISVDFGAGTADAQEGADGADDGYGYDRQCDLMRERNQRYLDLFEADMRAAGLAESTIRRHLDNVDFYLNVYLLHYDVNEMEYGCHDVDGFLGDFFIRKCMWSTPSTIKTNATSIKKFYKCMRDNGHVSVDAYNELVRTIKENMADWQADCTAFNDPSTYDNPFFDGDSFGGAPLGGVTGGVGVAGGGFSELGSVFGLSPDLEGYFKEALKDILQERLVEQFGNGFDEAAAVSLDAFASAQSEFAALTHDEAVRKLTLALFFLTSWEERVGGKGGPVVRRAWKSADWDALDALREEGHVDCTNKAKSVTLTDAGAAEARALLHLLGMGHLAE